jgi:hypothetical protein
MMHSITNGAIWTFDRSLNKYVPKLLTHFYDYSGIKVFKNRVITYSYSSNVNNQPTDFEIKVFKRFDDGSFQLLTTINNYYTFLPLLTFDA